MSATACNDDELTLTRDDGLSWYRSSDHAGASARLCGSVLFWKGDGRNYAAIAAGSIDGPLGVPLEAHPCDSAGDYYEIAGGKFRTPGRRIRRRQ